MVRLLLIVFVASIGVGLCQRVLPKGYKFKCQPKEGQGILGMFEDMSKLNKDDYSKMLEFDSLRKVAEVMIKSLSNLRNVRDTDEYKEFADYTCSKAYIDMDFYLDNAIAFHKYVLNEFPTKPPIPDEENQRDFEKLTNLLLLNPERKAKMDAIKLEHASKDTSVNVTNQAIDSDEFEALVKPVMNLKEWKNIEKAIDETGIDSGDALFFTLYYAETFWERSNSASFKSVSNALYLICAFYVIKSFKLF